MKLDRPPTPPPDPPIQFHCRACNRVTSVTREALSKTMLFPIGSFVLTRPCVCGALARRVTRPTAEERRTGPPLAP